MAAGGEGLAQAPAPGPGFQAPRDLFAPGAVPSTPRAPDSVVVTVNGKPVLQKEVNREVDRAFAQVAAQVPAEQVAQARQQIAQRVMEGLISRQLLLIGVEQKGIQITPEEMAGVRQQIEAQVPAGQSFETLLAAQGITRAEFEENLGRDLRVQKLIAAITGPAPAPTEEQVKEFYQQNEAQMMMPDQVRARHILIRSPEADPQSLRADKRAKAEDLRKKLADGADFAALVREHSEDPGSVQRGGEYVFGRGQMVPPFEQAAFSQDINAIGPVVETAFGYHIIQVLARQQAHKQSIEEASPKIGQFLQHQARQRLLEQYITELRATAKIEFPTP
jgi:peptidyl-prolyl cis-trans isomerase C